MKGQKSDRLTIKEEEKLEYQKEIRTKNGTNDARTGD